MQLRVVRVEGVDDVPVLLGAVQVVAVEARDAEGQLGLGVVGFELDDPGLPLRGVRVVPNLRVERGEPTHRVGVLRVVPDLLLELGHLGRVERRRGAGRGHHGGGRRVRARGARGRPELVDRQHHRHDEGDDDDPRHPGGGVGPLPAGPAAPLRGRRGALLSRGRGGGVVRVGPGDGCSPAGPAGRPAAGLGRLVDLVQGDRVIGVGFLVRVGLDDLPRCVERGDRVDPRELLLDPFPAGLRRGVQRSAQLLPSVGQLLVARVRGHPQGVQQRASDP